MRWNVRPGAAVLAVPLLAAMLACKPVPRMEVAPPHPLVAAAACAGGWQLRVSVKECAMRTAAAAIVGAVLPLPFAVPVSLGLALGALFTCF